MIGKWRVAGGEWRERSGKDSSKLRDLSDAPPTPVFFVRVAGKGLMLDAASRFADVGFKVSAFSMSCE